MLLPGIVIELELFLEMVLSSKSYTRAAARTPLSPARKSLVFFAVAILLISSFIRSNVLDINTILACDPLCQFHGLQPC